MATLESVEAKIEKLQAQADALKKKRSAAVIAQIHSLMSEHGLSFEDLGSTSDGKKLGGKAATKKSSGEGASVAKYRDPKSGATWSGRGRAPGWIASARNRDRFLIDSSVGSAPVERKKTAKPGNYIRGKQPAMYRDPKTGKEWSGRGMAPGWLAGARDRTKFLIDAGATKTADVKQSAPKAAAAKKAGAKKATATASAKKTVAKNTSPTSAKPSTTRKAAAKKSRSSAKNGSRPASKKTAGRKSVAKRSGGKPSANAIADSAALPSAISSSEIPSVASAV